MADVSLVLAAAVAAVMLRRATWKPIAGRFRGRLVGIVALVLAWSLASMSSQAPTSVGLVAAALVIIFLAGSRPPVEVATDLRCASCGNYFPSRDHFASKQICLGCAQTSGTASP